MRKTFFFCYLPFILTTDPTKIVCRKSSSVKQNKWYYRTLFCLQLSLFIL